MNKDGTLNYTWFTITMMMISVMLSLVILDAPFWVISVVSAALIISMSIPYLNLVCFYLYNLAIRPTLYVFALIATIQGKQDGVAVAFYIIIGLQAFFIIKNCFAYLITLISFFTVYNK